jgi:S-adenosylmethionine decarboxylase
MAQVFHLRQLLAELHGCNGQIGDPAALMAALARGAEQVGASVISDSLVTYTPHGSTVVVFLAESHAMVTTWPELDIALVDILLCNVSMDYEVVLREVVRLLEPARVSRQFYERPAPSC